MSCISGQDGATGGTGITGFQGPIGNSGLPGPAGFTGATGAKGAKGRRRRRQAGCPGKRNAIVPVAEGRITDCCVLCNKVENGDRRQFVGMPLYYSFVVGPGPTSNTVRRVPGVHNPNENASWLLCGTEFCEYFTSKDIERCTCIGVNPS